MSQRPEYQPVARRGSRAALLVQRSAVLRLDRLRFPFLRIAIVCAATLRLPRVAIPRFPLLCTAILFAATLLLPTFANAQGCCTSLVRVELTGWGGVRVAWCLADNAGPFEAFRVVREVAGNTVIVADEIEADLRNYIDLDPVCATTNNYSVFARLAGASEWTQLNYTRWVCTPANVTRFEARCGDVGVTLSWALEGPHAILGFRVLRKAEGDVTWARIHDGLLPATARSYKDRDACPGVRHEYALELMSPDLGPLSEWETTATPTASLTLQQNYPNPFNPSTTIGFTVASLDRVSIVVYDIAGRRVRELFDGTPASIGYHEIPWDGRTDRGDIAGSGVYFYRMTAPGLDETRRMVMVR